MGVKGARTGWTWVGGGVSLPSKDPATGQVLRRLINQIGIVKVADVDDVSSVGTVVSGSGFKTGDAVKTKTQ
jgi:hypothetical protein